MDDCWKRRAAFGNVPAVESGQRQSLGVISDLVEPPEKKQNGSAAFQNDLVGIRSKIH